MSRKKTALLRGGGKKGKTGPLRENDRGNIFKLWRNHQKGVQLKCKSWVSLRALAGKKCIWWCHLGVDGQTAGPQGGLPWLRVEGERWP